MIIWLSLLAWIVLSILTAPLIGRMLDRRARRDEN
jgi:hypothetical protein